MSQVGARHCVEAPGIVHCCVSSAPLQVPLQPVLSPMHGPREPTGLPLTGEQVPGDAGRLQA